MKRILTASTSGKKQKFLTDISIEVFACFLLSLGIGVFAAPNHIVGGGVSGIATILNAVFKLSIGLTTFLMNLPLIIVGYRRIGRRFILRTLRIVVILSLMMELIISNVSPYVGQQLLAAIFGGVLSGLGLALVLMRGDSTGGSDIIVKLIKISYPHMSFGFIVMITDIAVVALSAVVFKNLESLLYGMIMIYSSSQVIDRIISGSDMRLMVIVITKNSEIIAERLLTKLERGVASLEATGGYSKNAVGALLCVIERQQLGELKKEVYGCDSEAFVIVCHASETLGKGFKQIKDN